MYTFLLDFYNPAESGRRSRGCKFCGKIFVSAAESGIMMPVAISQQSRSSCRLLLPEYCSERSLDWSHGTIPNSCRWLAAICIIVDNHLSSLNWLPELYSSLTTLAMVPPMTEWYFTPLGTWIEGGIRLSVLRHSPSVARGPTQWLLL